MTAVNSITEYFRGALKELHQVRWPTRKQAVRLSVIVLLFTLSTALLYGVVDFVFGRGVSALLNLDVF